LQAHAVDFHFKNLDVPAHPEERRSIWLPKGIRLATGR
jgi:hypothetical protein